MRAGLLSLCGIAFLSCAGAGDPALTYEVAGACAEPPGVLLTMRDACGPERFEEGRVTMRALEGKEAWAFAAEAPAVMVELGAFPLTWTVRYRGRARDLYNVLCFFEAAGVERVDATCVWDRVSFELRDVPLDEIVDEKALAWFGATAGTARLLCRTGRGTLELTVETEFRSEFVGLAGLWSRHEP
ncbi:MAG: hypothetical protein ACYTAF_13035 [Planctomycetota bacterium]|jgi:hypothetical protein